MSVKVALIQMDISADVAENLARASAQVKIAAANSAQFVMLPEMFCCPYTNSSFRANNEPRGGRIWRALQAMAADNGIYLIGGSMPEAEDGNIYNTCFIFSPSGEQLARHRKVHLFDIDVPGRQRFFESHTFTPGNEITVLDTELGRIGVEICFDIRFEELTRLMALDGAQMIFVPAAFNMTTGPVHWETHFRARALDNQLFMLGCAPARDMNGAYISYGHSIVTSPWGEVLNELDFESGILYQELDLGEIDTVRAQLPIMKNRRGDLYKLETR